MHKTVPSTWPTPYIDDSVKSPNRTPGLTRDDILGTAPGVAAQFLDDDPTFAEAYRGIVSMFQEDDCDHSADYLRLLKPHLRSANPAAVANEHDFANVHRAVWLLLYETIVRLLNFNIHDGWGDPPPGGTAHGQDLNVSGIRIEQFHNVPNATGYFAIGTSDYSPPAISAIAVNRTAGGHTAVSATSDVLAVADLRHMSRALARKLVATPSLGDSYLKVVKGYYGDHGNHTPEYAAFVGGNAPAGPAFALGDDDVANVHRAMWLFLIHRFGHLVGSNPFKEYADVTTPQHSVVLKNKPGGLPAFEFPNDRGKFKLNLTDVD